MLQMLEYLINNTCLISAGHTEYSTITEWMATLREDTNKKCNICHENTH